MKYAEVESIQQLLGVNGFLGVNSSPRICERFLISGLSIQSLNGSKKKSNPKLNAKNAAQRLNLSYGTVRRILRKTLHWKAYKSHITQGLIQANKDSRLAA